MIGVWSLVGDSAAALDGCKAVDDGVVQCVVRCPEGDLALLVKRARLVRRSLSEGGERCRYCSRKALFQTGS